MQSASQTAAAKRATISRHASTHISSGKLLGSRLAALQRATSRHSVPPRLATAEEAARRDPVFDREAETKVEYVCKTSKKLVLKRIFLNAKSS